MSEPDLSQYSEIARQFLLSIRRNSKVEKEVLSDSKISFGNKDKKPEQVVKQSIVIEWDKSLIEERDAALVAFGKAIEILGESAVYVAGSFRSVVEAAEFEHNDWSLLLNEVLNEHWK